MFYIIKEYESYDFVLDSSDSSVEMVEHDDLLKSGVVYDYCTDDINYIKICTLYGFNKIDGNNYDKFIVHYNLPIRFESGEVSNVVVSLILRVLDGNFIIGDIFEDSDVVAFMQIVSRNLYISGRENKLFKRVCGNINSYIGIPVPFSMVPYIMRLKGEQNFDKLDSAFDYLLTKKLSLINLRHEFSGKVYNMCKNCKVNNISWRE